MSTTEASAVASASRHFKRSKAPRISTPAILDCLDEYFARENIRNRKKAVMALLGCSESTARRLTSRRTAYTSAIKLEWAVRIIIIAGKNPLEVLGIEPGKTYTDCIRGWGHHKDAYEALRQATDCATSIIRHSSAHYHMSGAFTVYTNSEGRPTVVEIFLGMFSGIGGPQDHRITMFAEKSGGDAPDKTFVRYHDEKGEDQGVVILSEAQVFTILTAIYNSGTVRAQKTLHNIVKEKINNNLI